MRDFDHLTNYAKEKVETAETPLNLYSKAQFKKNALDTVVTVLVASVVLTVTTIQMSSQATIQSPAVKKVIQQELVASAVNP